jgi:hypothetical protein
MSFQEHALVELEKKYGHSDVTTILQAWAKDKADSVKRMSDLQNNDVRNNQRLQAAREGIATMAATLGLRVTQ